MKRIDKIKQDLINEMLGVLDGNVDKVKSGLASDREKQAVFETLGFLNMINYSSMDILEIKKHWDKTNIKFM